MSVVAAVLHCRARQNSQVGIAYSVPLRIRTGDCHTRSLRHFQQLQRKSPRKDECDVDEVQAGDKAPHASTGRVDDTRYQQLPFQLCVQLAGGSYLGRSSREGSFTQSMAIFVLPFNPGTL